MDSDELGTVALTVTSADWRTVVDQLDKRCLDIVRGTLEQATRVPWLRRGEVSLLLADDRQLQDLNACYRDRDRATNVLSFPTIDADHGQVTMPPPFGPLLLGDVAISLERVMAEAAEHNKAVLDHFAHLLVHGVLHLLGYDHEDEADAEKMEAMEEAVLTTLGMAAAYDREACLDPVQAPS